LKRRGGFVPSNPKDPARSFMSRVGRPSLALTPYAFRLRSLGNEACRPGVVKISDLRLLFSTRGRLLGRARPLQPAPDIPYSVLLGGLSCHQRAISGMCSSNVPGA
jgi:hypothetical protein